MMRRHTGMRPWPLTGSTGQTVTWAAGGQGQFLLGDIPKVADGNLCPHLLGILVTFFVTLGSGGVETHSANVDRFLTWLVDSVEVRNAWHGTPVSQTHAKGCMLGLMEFIACGYQYFGRRMSVPAFEELDARTIEVNTFIPLSYNLGDAGHQTALPSIFYRNAELVLNFGLGSADAQGEGQNTVQSATVVASAMLLDESEIHLGPGNQFVDYPCAVSAGSESVKMDSFGNSTSLQKIEAGAGVDFLFWLSSHYNQGSSFAGPALVRDIRRVQIPFRGIHSTTHIQPFLLGFEAAIGGREDGESDAWDATAMDTVKANLSGFPYAHNYAGGLAADFAADRRQNRDMLGFPIIYPGRNLNLTKVASYEGTQSFMLAWTAAGAPTTGTHHTFAHQFHSWTPAAWDEALQYIADTGLAKAVMGTNTGLGWATKLTYKNPSPGGIDPAKLRYLPQKVALLSTKG
jgi:hypothetical protein